MQDSTSYKLNNAISNWFKSSDSDLNNNDDDTMDIKTTFYCPLCTSHKDIKLRVKYKDSLNRSKYKCINCMSKMKGKK